MGNVILTWAAAAWQYDTRVQFTGHLKALPLAGRSGFQTRGIEAKLGQDQPAAHDRILM